MSISYRLKSLFARRVTARDRINFEMHHELKQIRLSEQKLTDELNRLRISERALAEKNRELEIHMSKITQSQSRYREALKKHCLHLMAKKIREIKADKLAV